MNGDNHDSVLGKLSHIGTILAFLATAFLPAGYAARTTAPAQAAVIAWYDGPSQYSTITNCVSVIQGAPYQEYGAGAYVGFLANPDTAQPSPNQPYYVHIVVAGMGNACSGMRAYLDLGLPSNTSLAIDATNKVYCFYDNAPLAFSECPQSLPPSTYNPGMFSIPSADTAHANLWPVASGHFLEIQVPVISTTTLNNAAMVGKVWMLDGNSNPWLQPQQGVDVFSSQATILYANPSTTSIQSTTAHSEAQVFTHGVGGTGYFDLGTDPGYSLGHNLVDIPSGGNAFQAWDDWGPPALLPDTLYHWRFTFTPSGGATIYGADQTFHTLPSGVAVVGSGVTGSCAEADFTNALASGATQIKFACGPLPTTITLTAARAISTNISIDGATLVTLSGGGATNHFTVQSGGHLSLSRIKLVSGSNTASCGGAIRVQSGGQITLNEVTFENNSTTFSGGAVCVEAGASGDIHFSTFNANHSLGSTGGGGVFNGGTLTLDHSIFTANTTTRFGGGYQNYGTGTLSDNSFNQNTASVNGGGIDAVGTLTVTRGSFNGNTAGIRGGGINQYTGTLTVTDSSFISNVSNGYGGGLVNDAATVHIFSSEFSANTAASVGGGLRSNGKTDVTNSTFSGNHANQYGGGIENSSTGATLTLLNTTLSGNSAGAGGGNIYIGALASTSIALKNTLLAAGAPNNCSASLFSQGNNLESANTCGLTASGDLVNSDPKLGPLHNNGGPTRTLALLLGSPAIDAAANAGCPAKDARGVTRPLDGNGDGIATCDIGAYEASDHPYQVNMPDVAR